MSVTATCSGCGRSYTVGEKLYGKRVKCKQCGASFQIPMPAGGATSVGAASAFAAPPPPGSPYARATARRKVEYDPASKAWLYGHVAAFGFPLLLLGLGRLIPALVMPAVMIAVLVGMVMMFWGNIGILLSVAREGGGTLLMYLLIPFYAPYYVISRFSELQGHVGRALGGAALIILAAMSVPHAKP